MKLDELWKVVGEDGSLAVGVANGRMSFNAGGTIMHLGQHIFANATFVATQLPLSVRDALRDALRSLEKKGTLGYFPNDGIVRLTFQGERTWLATVSGGSTAPQLDCKFEVSEDDLLGLLNLIEHFWLPN